MEVVEEEIPDIRPNETRKRRSSIFQRRSIVTNAINGSEDLEETVDKASVQRDEQEPAPEEAFDLQKYVDKLKEEIAAWHDVSNERKDEHHKLAKKKAEIKKSGQEADLNLLTEDERKFIDDRPNLDHLMSSGKDLLDLSVKIVQLNQHYIRRYDYLQSLIERRINEAKEKIISLID